MGNSKVKFSNVCYLIAGISIILIIAILSNYFRDMEDSSWEIKKEIQVNSARIASGYIEDFIEGREAALSLLGSCIPDDGTVEEKLFAEAGLFDNIVLVDRNGSVKYGVADTGEIAGIRDEEEFGTALSGQCVVSDGLSSGHNGKTGIRIYAPVTEAGGKINSVLVASVYDSTISSYIESKISAPDVYIAVMSSKGRIILGSNDVYKFIGKAGSSYFSYLKSCDIRNDDIGTDDMQKSMRGHEEIFIEYSYDDNDYIASCIPLGLNGYYMIYTGNSDNTSIKGKIISKSNEILLKIFIVDLFIIFVILFYHITDRAKITKRLDNYGIVDRQEGAVLFEYTFYPKKIQVYGEFEQLLGRKFDTLAGEAVYDVYDIVHEDDASIRGRLHEFFDSDNEFFSSELRIADAEGNYGWFRIMGTMFRDNTGKCERFVGKLVNANRQISMEKNLVQRAENDLLTGVLNKKTIESKVTECLNKKHEGRNYIFYMVDLDNFKNVNDKLGHIFGDRAIADTAKALKDIFHSNAYIGRLGGDEFAVFVVYDAFDEESLVKYIIKNAEKICAANRREYTDGANTVRITSSVGISIGPKDGSTFEMLYKRADESLYKSKNTGKNKYTIYGNYTGGAAISKMAGSGKKNSRKPAEDSGKSPEEPEPEALEGNDLNIEKAPGRDRAPDKGIDISKDTMDKDKPAGEPYMDILTIIRKEPGPSNFVLEGSDTDMVTKLSKRIVRIMKEKGYLSNGHVAKISAEKLAALDTGSFKSQLKGNCMLVDGASGLTDPAVKNVISLMDWFNGDFIVILTGRKDIFGKLFKSMPGFKERFKYVIDTDIYQGKL